MTIHHALRKNTTFAQPFFPAIIFPFAPNSNNGLDLPVNLRDHEMCGIYASVSKQGFHAPSDVLKELLCNRGPDHVGEAQARIDLEDGASSWISLMSTVLALRGGHVTAQPFIDVSSNSALCWNGEAWKIGLDSVTGNDGQAVFDMLIKASSDHAATSDSTTAILGVLQNISGPFAFVYLDKYHNQLYFGRDRLGRRSLLHKTDGHTNLQLSSIADTVSGPWMEIEADAVHRISFNEPTTSSESVSGSNHEPPQTPFFAMHKHMWASEESEASVSPPLNVFKTAP